MSTINRFEELNKLTLKGNYEINLFKIAKSLKISPYNKCKKDLIQLIIQAEKKVKKEKARTEKKVKHETKFKETSCCVCCEDFDEDFKPLQPCGHWIHETCVANSGKLECPLCRSPVELTQMNKKLANEKKVQYRTEEARQVHDDIMREEARQLSIDLREEGNQIVIDIPAEGINIMGSRDVFRSIRSYDNVSMRSTLINTNRDDLLFILNLVRTLESIGI